jgi:hypothetical protein
MRNKYYILNLITLLIGFSSCSYQVSTPIVKIRYEYNFVYRTNIFSELSKWRKKKTKIGYIKYDRNGNEIEAGEYGEIWHFHNETKNPDNSVSVVSGHGRYMKKLNTVSFKAYNQDNQIISDDYWSYKDNKKDYLIYRTEFKYINGELVSEVEYDSEGKISREMRYSDDKTIQINDNKRPFYDPIVRVEGNNKYEIKYDSLGREIEMFHYLNGIFLRRTLTIYKHNLKTTYLYDDSPDKLWCYTEEKYNFLTDKLIRKYWKVLDSTVERKEIFEYNIKGLLKKILTYDVDLVTGKDELESYTKYKYKYY